MGGSTVIFDIPGLQSLSGTVQRNSVDLEALVNALNGAVSQANWQGTAAERFRDNWNQQRSALLQLKESLDAVKQEIDQRVQMMQNFNNSSA